MKIIKLDSSVYNKIAAGEVVERPASVVKELLENSIDAGATRIEISVKNGGLDEITVTDNGCGIEKEDLKTAFLPHATSKIKTAEDLSEIKTLGFRGEALPSIASVSMVTITSKTEEAEMGSSLSLRGGQIEEEGVRSMTRGTEITVKNLFFNTPARLKFLKTPSGELADIKNAVLKTILANPSLVISLSDEKGEIYKTHGEGLADCIETVFSKDLCENLLPVSFEKHGIRVSGFTSKSVYSKSNKSYQISIINGRVAENQSISSAITTVYSHYLMKRCYPVVILNIKIDPSEIDVNVHPTKAEVRFSDNSAVFSAVYNALNTTVEKDIAETRLMFNTVNDECEQLPTENIFSAPTAPVSKEETEQPITAKADFLEEIAAENVSKIEHKKPKLDFFTKSPFASESSFEEESPIVNAIKNNFKKLEEKKPEQTVMQGIDSYRIIGQVFGTYLLLEYAEKFIIVDQHAAVERLRYDKLLAEYQAGNVAVQPLLFSEQINVSPAEYEIVSKKLHALKEIGVELIPFGDNCFKLLSVPSILADLDLSVFVKEILSDKAQAEPDLVRDKLAYAACRSSIKGNTYLNNEEIAALMDAYFKKGLPLQCPHGRPAYFVYTKKDIEKLFKRIV